MKWVNSHAYCRHVQYTPVLTCATRSSAIAGRQCDANACQRLLKWTWKWQPSWHNLQMSFKVINSGTNRNLVYDFLLMVYSNFCHITHRFLKKIDVKQFNDLEILPRSSTVASRESCRVAMYVKCSKDSERVKRKSPFSTTPLSFDAPSPANRITIAKTVQRIASHGNKKVSYCWETVRRESTPRIAEMDVEWQPRLKWPSMYFKVIKSGTDRKLVYVFL